ncbi:hypothetical protein TRFO_27971 [Tritrichomonas foetus]|uniref:Uncharacterized protein n=1 Tax=Tritrichomonas foetus TaxID=1144522 RepID=A0A1J4JZC5_9EUKA|nr:hypothetical protein TRFO_27971 [Tritrichomonas foetus]|eukprot:OHT04527.1 hypothetical protein TRFO_27971 [Tritrichomonas foetus]
MNAKDLGDLNEYSTRKLMYICSQNKIPLPLQPSRQILIDSIKKFFTEKKKAETPKAIKHQTNTNGILETPKIPMTNENMAPNAQPTPIYVNRSISPSNRGSRQPSPVPSHGYISPIINALADQMQREANRKNPKRLNCNLIFLICLLVFLIFVLILLLL